METNTNEYVTLKEYIDNQIRWLRYVKVRERQDMLREMERMDREILRISNDIAETNKALSNLSKLVYIGVGICIVLNVIVGILAVFLKR